MKIILSHTLLDATNAQTRAIAACFDATLPVRMAADIEEVDLRHVSLRHELVGVGTGRQAIEITISDEAIIRAMGLYLKIAHFVAPIVKAWRTFSESFADEVDEFSFWLYDTKE